MTVGVCVLVYSCDINLLEVDTFSDVNNLLKKKDIDNFIVAHSHSMVHICFTCFLSV